MTYPVIDVPEDSPNQLEQLGTKSKFWYDDENNRRMLFKVGRPDTGENWAEKVGCEICGLLNIPHAHYEFGKCGDKNGVVSETFVPDNARLILGNELLGHVYKEVYDENTKYRSSQHTVRRALALTTISDINFPLNSDFPNLQSAGDVFVGYLMLDALISNTDRHHENWGLIITGSQLSLAPTFDHASSLGRNESDENRIARLGTTDSGFTVDAYVNRAKSALYETPNSKNPLTTMDAFRESAKICPDGGRYWLGALENTGFSSYEAIFARIPKDLISEAGIEFALKMLESNTKKLLMMDG